MQAKQGHQNKGIPKKQKQHPRYTEKGQQRHRTNPYDKRPGWSMTEKEKLARDKLTKFTMKTT